MPFRYELKCPKCGWIGDRICKMEERDQQICGQVTEVHDSGMPPPVACDGKLERGIDLNASMRHYWQV